MKIVIVGDGKVGAALTEELSKEGHDIVVIDKNSNVLKKTMETFDVMGIQGNGASLKVQKEADVQSSDLLIAVTSGDEINLMCCILAKKLGVGNTIARVRNPEYEEQLYFLKDELGLSMTVNPEKMAADEIARLLQYPTLLKRDSFARGRVEIVELKIKENSTFDGIRLNEIYRVCKVKVLICGVQRENEVFIPSGDFVLQGKDKIYVTAETENLTSMIEYMGLISRKIKNVIIVGGSRISYYLTKELVASGIRVKIIETDYERCCHLAEQLPGALVIHGDGSTQDILISEGVKNVDGVVTLTNIDEENLVISIHANHLGAVKTITKVNRLEYRYLLNDIGIDSVISPKLLTAYEIVRFVRAMGNTSGSGILTLHRFADNSIEALEFRAAKEANYLNRSLAELPIKNNMLIACIGRKGKIIIPSGNDHIELGDRVVVVMKESQAVSDLKDIFRGRE